MLCKIIETDFEVTNATVEVVVNIPFMSCEDAHAIVQILNKKVRKASRIWVVVPSDYAPNSSKSYV